jgi:hypothetical protein
MLEALPVAAIRCGSIPPLVGGALLGVANPTARVNYAAIGSFGVEPIGPGSDPLTQVFIAQNAALGIGAAARPLGG